MARKLGIGTVEIHKKFKNSKEAYLYARRLQDFINNEAKRQKAQVQALIVTSNLNRQAISYITNEQKEGVGRRKKQKHFNDIKIKTADGKLVTMLEFNGDQYTDWHIHLLVVSIPSYTFRKAIKEYIKKNWYGVSKRCIFSWKAKVAYTEQANIGTFDYFINQSEKALFCNKNYADKDYIPKKYSLKSYYNELVRINTLRQNTNKLDTREGNNKETVYYNEMRDFYYGITEEKDKKTVKRFLKQE